MSSPKKFADLFPEQLGHLGSGSSTPWSEYGTGAIWSPPYWATSVGSGDVFVPLPPGKLYGIDPVGVPTPSDKDVLIAWIAERFLGWRIPKAHVAYRRGYHSSNALQDLPDLFNEQTVCLVVVEANAHGIGVDVTFGTGPDLKVQWWARAFTVTHESKLCGGVTLGHAVYPSIRDLIK